MIEEFFESLDSILLESGYKLIKGNSYYRKYSGNSYLEISIKLDGELPLVSISDGNNCLKGYLISIRDRDIFILEDGDLIYGGYLSKDDFLYKLVNSAIKKMNAEYF